MKRFWRWLALFAYRRWATEGDPKPVGVPGNRDPQHPCNCYAPRPWRLGDFADCQGDGHYLCRKCIHLDPGAPDNALVRPWITVEEIMEPTP